MGFFSKLWKKVTKPFKAVGKAIKKTVQKVGKVVNKLGIVGQIGLALILPGIGGMLGQAIGGMASWAGNVGGIVGKIVGGAAKFASTVGRTFQTVTAGIKNFVGEFAKTAATKLGFNIEGAATNFFGEGGAFDIAGKETMKVWDTSTWGQAVDSVVSDPAITGEVTTDAVVREPIDIEVPEPSLLEPVSTMPEGIPVVDALPPVEIMPTEQIIKQVPNMKVLSEFDIPEVEVPQQPSLFQRATTAVKEEAAGMVDYALSKPISTAIAGYQAYKSYTAPEVDYGDYTSPGIVMDVGQGAQFQAPTIDFIASAQMPYGYQASRADQVYQGGAWQRKMMGGFA